jgi:hypothetical protein
MGICNPHSIKNADITSSRISNSTEQGFYHTTPQFCRIYNSAEHNMGIYNPHSILGQAKRQSRAANAPEQNRTKKKGHRLAGL